MHAGDIHTAMTCPPPLTAFCDAQWSAEEPVVTAPIDDAPTACMQATRQFPMVVFEPNVAVPDEAEADLDESSGHAL